MERAILFVAWARESKDGGCEAGYTVVVAESGQEALSESASLVT